MTTASKLDAESTSDAARGAPHLMALVFLIGGARSGKSELALRLAREQTAPVVFVATGEAGDDEMRARIEQHRRERPPTWQTVEEPLRLQEALETIEATSCVIVDCL